MGRSPKIRDQSTNWGSACFVSLIGGNAHKPKKGQKYQLVCRVIQQNLETDEDVDI